MFAGENQPQDYMSWIIANTYHSMNPEVKNISYYEGRYKYRNWELKERYYPAIGAGDTLPKTTAQWPRYPADNRLLNIFDLSEMAAALKTTFTGKQDKMASLAAKAKADHQTQQEKTKQSYLASHQVKSTISQIIAGGLDEFNDRKFRYNYSYSPDGTGGYRNQQSEDIPPNERIKIEWIDLQKSMGLQQFNAAIKEYESNAQSKHDRIVRDAKADLDRAKAQVANAKKSSKTKRKSSKN